MFNARANHPPAADEDEPRRRRRQRRINLDAKTLRVWKQIEDDDNYPMPPEAPEECATMSTWKSRSYPNCNSIHELDIHTRIRRQEFHHVATGGFNHVFRVRSRHSRAGSDVDVALKLLSLSRQVRSSMPPSTMYSRQNYDIVRRDALVSERLTKSRHVLPIYGYCGFATTVPFASEGGTLASTLGTKSAKGRTGWSSMSSSARLAHVVHAAEGLADVHDIEVVHGDIAAKQYIFLDGRLQLGDFNQGILLRRNSSTPDEACTFTRPVNDGTTRSPEEYMHTHQTSAVDVWSFGSILYHLLTGMKVWSHSGKKKYAVQAAVVEGLLPKIGKDIQRSSDPVDRLMMKALDMCQVYDPRKRATAREVASFLKRGLEELS